MARSKKEALRVALVLDLDEYVAGLAKAKNVGQQEGGRLEKGLGEQVNKIAIKFATIVAAVKLAEKAVKAFARTAEALEQSGQGNEGTAAMVRLEHSVEALWRSFVSTVLQLGLVEEGLAAAAIGAENAAKAVIKWEASLRGLGGVLDLMRAWTADAIADYHDQIEDFLRWSGRMLELQDPERAAKSLLPSKLNLSKAAGAFARSAAAKTGAAVAEIEATKIPERPEFLAAVKGTVNTFVQSWESGFARLADLFHKFSGEVSIKLGGMKASTVQALGDTFNAIAFTGPLVEKAFGQSAAAAKKFQAAQLALTGGFAVVKGVESLASAFDKAGDLNFWGQAAKVTAAGLYFSAAAMAGVAANAALSSSAGAGAASAMASPDRYAPPRKSITIVIENAVGGEEYIRSTIIPEINRAVNEGDVVMQATEAGRLGLS